jgi:hypothetical protein
MPGMTRPAALRFPTRYAVAMRDNSLSKAPGEGAFSQSLVTEGRRSATGKADLYAARLTLGT